MKLILFEIVLISFLFKNDFADARIQCNNPCSDGVDLKNIVSAIKHARCGGKVKLGGLESATKTVRSLVCKCDKLGHYRPKDQNCVRMYNCNIIIPLVQTDIPLIIQDIGRDVKRNVCKAIQVYIDNISNVYQSCIGGALSFQGDHTGGKQVEYYVDTCYNATIVDLTKTVAWFSDQEPGASKKILDIVMLHMGPERDFFYGPEFRACMGGLGRQAIENCDCKL